MTESNTDCRSTEGIFVGLLDSMITVSRVIRRMADANEDIASSPAAIEALKDLASDEDFGFLLELVVKTEERER